MLPIGVVPGKAHFHRPRRKGSTAPSINRRPHHGGIGRRFRRRRHHGQRPCRRRRGIPASYGRSLLGYYDGHVCGRLHTASSTHTGFFHFSRSRLDRSHGCHLANVHVQHDLDMALEQYTSVAKNVWNEVRFFDTRGAVNRNALVVVGNAKNLRKPMLLVPPLTGGEDIALHLDRMNFRACFRWVDSGSYA